MNINTMAPSYKAAILDLDGVITQTTSKHAKAWKQMFDEYNQMRKKAGEQPFTPFSIEEDYKKHLDGMPRYIGVANFLSSRLIELPHGKSTDDVGIPTICGLGNLKNDIFRNIIKQEGVNVYKENIEKVKVWKNEGFKTAIVSSSKNCLDILEAAKLENLFDVRVDGKVAAELNLKGKPCPDVFLEAAKQLKVNPEEAIVVEDSLAGVEAGKKGKFQLVIGIDNDGNPEALMNYGADVVVNSLTEINLLNPLNKTFEQLPSAYNNLNEIIPKHQNDQLFVFFDYDGTLTPIVEHPEKASLSEDMFALLFQLSQFCPTGIISGRDLQDITKKVNLEGLYYAGSHGFEISGPNGFFHENTTARDVLPLLDNVQKELEREMKDIKGVLLERKKFTLAIHYRQAIEDQIGNIINTTNSLVAQYQELKTEEGKKLIEIKPDLNWDKGKAVQFLIDKIASAPKKTYTVYIGDDLTDEDVFRDIAKGVGILVGNHQHKTFANYKLDDVKSVEIFLHTFLTHLKHKYEYLETGI